MSEPDTLTQNGTQHLDKTSCDASKRAALHREEVAIANDAPSRAVCRVRPFLVPLLRRTADVRCLEQQQSHPDGAKATSGFDISFQKKSRISFRSRAGHLLLAPRLRAVWAVHPFRLQL